MSENLSEQLQLLPDYLSSHLLISMIALALGIIVCLPLAVIVTRVKKLQWPTLAFASVMQTIPGIALLALMVPLLGQIGFLPALIALFLYSMLPILRNTVTGIIGVQPSLIEAARGLGMTPNQILWKVERPMAMPVIIAGIRTSTVWVVGTATLSTPVGATSLGNYIFSGLQTQNYTSVLIGCIAAAGLAIVLDGLIRLAESALSQKSKIRGIIAAIGLTLIVIGGLSTYVTGTEYESESTTVIIGSKPFTEQYILSELIGQSCKDAGFAVDTRSSMGSTILFEALKNNNVTCYVDYTGTLWANVMKRSDLLPSDELLAELTKWLDTQYGIRCLGPLGFENTYALAVKKHLADSLKIKTIADLSNYTPNLTIGSDYEFFSRSEWFAIRDNYKLKFKKTLSMDPSLMYSAILEDQIEVVTAYSTDGRIAASNLVVLGDPKQALPPYDAVLLLSPNGSENNELINALKPLIGVIDGNEMRQANKRVDFDKISVSNATLELKNSINNSQ